MGIEYASVWAREGGFEEVLQYSSFIRATSTLKTLQLAQYSLILGTQVASGKPISTYKKATSFAQVLAQVTNTLGALLSPLIVDELNPIFRYSPPAAG